MWMLCWRRVERAEEEERRGRKEEMEVERCGVG